MTLTQAQHRQVIGITLAAIGLFAGFRMLPVAGDLNHMDFRVSGGNVIEFCDPGNPQFLPVVTVRSPVVLNATASTPAVAGRLTTVRLNLATAQGKAIGPRELEVTHTQPLHLMIVDSALEDYQHVHPAPGGQPGEWIFEFTPARADGYRLFADFTPAATGRGLYSATDLKVTGEAAPSAPAASATETSGMVERDGVRYSLRPAEAFRAGRPLDLKFQVARSDGAPVALEPVMGAYAHLVAFDRDRTGFAHLHPFDSELTKAPDPAHPELNFKVTIPQAGRYVIWAQVRIEGRERFVPFWFEVNP